MGFANGYVASIILKNKPLREFKYQGKRTVKVPFGSEYTIRIKNKSKEPALVDVSIDDTDVLNGSSLLLTAGETVNLERFVSESSKGKKFKFISLKEGAATGEIDDPYRDENGVVRVKFHKTHHFPSLFNTLNNNFHLPYGSEINHGYHNNPIYHNNRIYEPTGPKKNFCSDPYAALNTTTGCAMASDSVNTNTSNFCNVLNSSRSLSKSCVSEDIPSDKGATVEGSESNQSFSTTSDYTKSSETPTTVDILMVGPNFKEEKVDDCEWGVYLNSRKKPEATFKDRKYAYHFAGHPSFKKDSVTVKIVA